METVDLIGLAVPLTYLLFAVTEKLWPARRFPPRKGWQWLGAAFLILILTVGTVVPLLIPAQWLAAHRWLDRQGVRVRSISPNNRATRRTRGIAA